MLTRLTVVGFTNFLKVEVRFRPFLWVAGPHGGGKANLFDAIRLLSALADRPRSEAALSVRDDSRRAGDVRPLFSRVGDNSVQQMTGAAEMMVPHEEWDALGQKAAVSSTCLH